MRRQLDRREGSVLLVTLVVVFTLAALVTAQFTVVQKNTRQAHYFETYSSLREYADSGARLALHDLRNTVTVSGGKIGTEFWTTAHDVGRDGQAGTQDEGEGDGRPNPGEPNIVPASIGPATHGIELFVFVEDSTHAGVKRIVSTAVNADAEASVEMFVRQSISSVPQVAAVYMDPSVTLDLSGNKFSINGDDTNPDGSAGPGASTYGIATEPGSPAGTNANTLITQASGSEDQITGLGYDASTNTPSIGEASSSIDIDATFESLLLQKDTTLAPGTHSNVTFGTPGAQEITYCNGDLHLSGSGTGAGILLVEGDLEMTGQFEFQGLVIVRGDVRQTGGGSGTHIYGSLWVTGYLTLVEDPELDFSGNADIYYSSAALAAVDTLIASSGGSYTVVYSNRIR